MRLRLMRSGLVAVVGCQGVGKSSAMRALACDEELSKRAPVAVKMPVSGALTDTLRSALLEEVRDQTSEYVKLILQQRLASDPILVERAERLTERSSDTEMRAQLDTLQGKQTYYGPMSGYLSDGFDHLFTKPELRKIQDDALVSVLRKKPLLLVDLPDYPRGDRRLIVKDLDDVAQLWNGLLRGGKYEGVIVLFVQREIFGSGHFFLGKMSITDLKPLTSSELLEAYKERWKTYEPFSPEALMYVSKIARGNFRSFKRFLSLTLETSSQPPIGLEVVKEAITDEEMMHDAAKELEAVFGRRRDMMRKAVELIKILTGIRLQRERDEATGLKSLSEFTGGPPPDGLQQRELAGKLGLNEMAVSRLVRELEQHGFLKRVRWQQWMYVQENW